MSWCDNPVTFIISYSGRVTLGFSGLAHVSCKVPWIFEGTLRENIVTKSAMHHDRRDLSEPPQSASHSRFFYPSPCSKDTIVASLQLDWHPICKSCLGVTR